MSLQRWSCVLLMLGSAVVALTQRGPAQVSGQPQGDTVRPNDLPLLEQLVVLRRNYQRTLEQLRFYYMEVGDQERAKMAEKELLAYHRSPRDAFNEDLWVPPPTLRGDTNVTAANNLLTRARVLQEHSGWGSDYIDNQRRAEILLDELLTKYPHSNKISEAAFLLGEIYEGKANQMYRRAAWFYTRCFQWNDKTTHDALLRAARLYDVQLRERAKAMEFYQMVKKHDTHPANLKIADQRLAELSKR